LEACPFAERSPNPARHPKRAGCTTDGCGVLEKGACRDSGGEATITIRLDADLLEWLRKQKGYQTRINAVLRSYMDASLAS
jgi:uncharacterized protein (DUF4415 family)